MVTNILISFFVGLLIGYFIFRKNNPQINTTYPITSMPDNGSLNQQTFQQRLAAQREYFARMQKYGNTQDTPAQRYNMW